MGKYFTRAGVELEDRNVGLIRGGNIKVLWETANGSTIKYLWDRPCQRCGGAGGSPAWAHTGYVCYDCRGTGRRGSARLVGYSAEKLAQLDATRIKRREKAAAKREAEAAAVKRAAEAALVERLEGDALLRDIRDHADQGGVLADFWAQVSQRNRELTDRQREFAASLIKRARAEAEAKARQALLDPQASHVGAVGDRIEIDGVVEAVFSFQSAFTLNGKIIKIRQGADILVWFTGACDITRDHVGLPITGKGTVKKHGDRDDVPQTILTRCKLVVADRDVPMTSAE